MNAQQLAFPDGVFDAVYAPYVINVVPDPIRAAREMVRVCRPGGRLIFLNHFDGTEHAANVVNRAAGVAATWLTGVDWHLDLGDFLREAGLRADSVEAVNIPPVTSLVVCRAA
jgi:phosphatidylethanolamine/phosphatidyl-N-methylethanolamine N-methyltransferase